MRKIISSVICGFLIGCTIVPKDTEPPSRQSINILTEEDYKIVLLIAKNAFYEAFTEEHSDIETQIHSVLNRASRWHKGDIRATIEKPWAYSWKKLYSKELQQEIMENNYDTFNIIFDMSLKIYKDHKLGIRKSNVIGYSRDHYLTTQLANWIEQHKHLEWVQKKYEWYISYCDNKMTVGNHSFCKGIPKIKGVRR